MQALEDTGEEVQRIFRTVFSYFFWIYSNFEIQKKKKEWTVDSCNSISEYHNSVLTKKSVYYIILRSLRRVKKYMKYMNR